MKYIIITTTCPDKETAQKIAKALVEKKLAACVQMQNIESFYTWDNKFCSGKEVLCVIKTTAEKYNAVEAAIKSLHPYTCPQIIMLPIAGGSRDYLDWIKDSVDTK